MSKPFLKILLCISAYFAFGCVTGPKQTKNSEGVNTGGERYELAGNVLGVPVINRVPVQAIISGKVLSRDPLDIVSAGTEVQLLQSNKLIAKVNTGPKEDFRFVGDYVGSYILKVENRRFYGFREVKIDSSEQKDIQLFVNKTQN